MPYNLQHIYFFFGNQTFRNESQREKRFVEISSGTTSLSCVFSIHDHTTCYPPTKMAGLFDQIFKCKKIRLIFIVGSRVFNVVLYQIHIVNVFETWSTRNIEILFHTTVISIRNFLLY